MAKEEQPNKVKPSKLGLKNINMFIDEQEKVIKTNAELRDAMSEQLKLLDNMNDVESLKRMCKLSSASVIKLVNQFESFYRAMIEDLEEIIKTGG